MINQQFRDLGSGSVVPYGDCCTEVFRLPLIVEQGEWKEDSGDITRWLSS
jgi:hypothetical protein